MCKRLLLAIVLATVFVIPVFADVTAESKCDVNTFGVTHGPVDLEAIWTPKTFTCEAGKYLDGRIGECTICPNGSYCSGIEETEFDDENHGIESCETGWTSEKSAVSESNCYQVGMAVCAEQNPYTLGHGTAVYTHESASCKTFYGTTECVLDDSHACDIMSLQCESGYMPAVIGGVLKCVVSNIECNAGTYLPRDSLTCATCPGDSYCPGGEYDASSTESHGAVKCPDGLKAPRGARSENDCGRLFHVGDNTLHMHKDKRTEHSLAIKVDGVTYYADTTPVSEGVKTINPDTTETLRVKIDGVEYFVHETIYE